MSILEMINKNKAFRRQIDVNIQVNSNSNNIKSRGYTIMMGILRDIKKSKKLCILNVGIILVLVLIILILSMFYNKR